MESPTGKNWAECVIELRRDLKLSQEGLAALLQTYQCTVSRWERGISSPNYQMQAKLADLYRDTQPGIKYNIGAVRDIAQILIDSNITNAMLLHPDGTVIAVSPNLGYHPGFKLIDQTIPEELNEFRALEAFLEEVGFWDTLNTCFEYAYRSQNSDLCAILTSLQIDSQIYCLAQRKSVAPASMEDA